MLSINKLNSIIQQQKRLNDYKEGEHPESIFVDGEKLDFMLWPQTSSNEFEVLVFLNFNNKVSPDTGSISHKEILASFFETIKKYYRLQNAGIVVLQNDGKIQDIIRQLHGKFIKSEKISGATNPFFENLDSDIFSFYRIEQPDTRTDLQKLLPHSLLIVSIGLFAIVLIAVFWLFIIELLIK